MTKPTEPSEHGDPISRLSAIASSATDPSAPTTYKPTPADAALAGSLLTTRATTFVELAEKAGISVATLYRVMDDPNRCAWIISRAAQISKIGLTAVYARLLEMALTSKSASWTKLFLERFDDDFKQRQASAAGDTLNLQFNVIQNMTDDELRAFISQKARQVVGKIIDVKPNE